MVDGGCTNLDFPGIHPDQLTQFNVGWTFDGLYTDAMAYYGSLQSQVAVDGEDPLPMQQHEVFPLTPPVDWWGYICSFIAGQ